MSSSAFSKHLMMLLASDGFGKIRWRSCLVLQQWKGLYIVNVYSDCWKDSLYSDGPSLSIH